MPAHQKSSDDNSCDGDCCVTLPQFLILSGTKKESSSASLSGWEFAALGPEVDGEGDGD
jgi:hypothetical protein